MKSLLKPKIIITLPTPIDNNFPKLIDIGIEGWERKYGKPQTFAFNRNYFDKPRYTWNYAPSWWNEYGEFMKKINDVTVTLEYWGTPIPINSLIELDPIAVATKQKNIILINDEYYAVAEIIQLGLWKQLIELDGKLYFPPNEGGK
ncbi:MAG TPA: hypothetical protein VK184_22960 [Nostocaceae cyanobacterium]|nr:hypothetical protein [Nostocaceae cyanobacterium]